MKLPFPWTPTAFKTLLVLQMLVEGSSGFRSFYEDNVKPSVKCKAVRNYTSVESVLLFTCATSGLALDSVTWTVSPASCCVSNEIHRTTDMADHKENTDANLMLVPSMAVRGYVMANVYNEAHQSMLAAFFSFAVVDSIVQEDCYAHNPCGDPNTECSVSHNTFICRCSQKFGHYDHIHGVCYRPRNLGAKCQYMHQCQKRNPLSECSKGKCDCGYISMATPATSGDEPRCTQAAHLGDNCNEDQVCVGIGVACTEDGYCACNTSFVREGISRCRAVSELVPEELSQHRAQWKVGIIVSSAMLLGVLVAAGVRARKWAAWCHKSSEGSELDLDSGSPGAGITGQAVPLRIAADRMEHAEYLDPGKQQSKLALESAL